MEGKLLIITKASGRTTRALGLRPRPRRASFCTSLRCPAETVVAAIKGSAHGFALFRSRLEASTAASATEAEGIGAVYAARRPFCPRVKTPSSSSRGGVRCGRAACGRGFRSTLPATPGGPSSPSCRRGRRVGGRLPSGSLRGCCAPLSSPPPLLLRTLCFTNRSKTFLPPLPRFTLATAKRPGGGSDGGYDRKHPLKRARRRD